MSTPEWPPEKAASNNQPKQVDLIKSICELGEVFRSPVLGSSFAAELEKAGLLTELENAGIIPPETCPNPYHPEIELEQNEQWWKDHPEEGEDFMERVDKREEALRYLYVGDFLGRWRR